MLLFPWFHCPLNPSRNCFWSIFHYFFSKEQRLNLEIYGCSKVRNLALPSALARLADFLGWTSTQQTFCHLLFWDILDVTTQAHEVQIDSWCLKYLGNTLAWAFLSFAYYLHEDEECFQVSCFWMISGLVYMNKVNSGVALDVLDGGLWETHHHASLDHIKRYGILSYIC